MGFAEIVRILAFLVWFPVVCLAVLPGALVEFVYASVQNGESIIGTISVDQSLEVVKMIWTIAAVLVVLWALGLVTSYTMGGLIHILVVLAVIAIVFQLLQGRKVV